METVHRIRRESSGITVRENAVVSLWDSQTESTQFVFKHNFPKTLQSENLSGELQQDHNFVMGIRCNRRSLQSVDERQKNLDP